MEKKADTKNVGRKQKSRDRKNGDKEHSREKRKEDMAETKITNRNKAASETSRFCVAVV